MQQILLEQLPREAVSHNSAIHKKVILRAGILPHLTNFAQAYFEPGQIAERHIHPDMNEVFFVLSGYGEILVEETCYPLVPGTCIVVEVGESHEVRNSGTELLILSYFGLMTEAYSTDPRQIEALG